MTSLPEMELAELARWLDDEALNADSRALNFKGDTPQRKEWQIRAKRFRAAALAARSTVPEAGKAVDETLQARVQPWMMACFGREISADRVERGDRLLEEVFELLQSGGYDPARVLALRDYVWGRDAGEPYQEVGGVMITLAAYCLAHGLNMHEAGETELARIWTKVEKIRAKQAAKPVGSALPVALASVPAPSGAELIAQWQVWVDADNDHGMDAGWVNEDADMIEHWRSQGRKVRALYAAPQAVPAEDVASLIASTEAELAAGSLSAMDLNTQSIALVRRLTAALTGLSARLDATETARYVAATNYLDLVKYKECLEAEAASLRRKLEEHRKALDIADRLIERGYGIDTPDEWHAAYRTLSGASE